MDALQAPPKRHWGAILAAWTCWHVALFFGVVPGVVLYFLGSLASEVGVRNLLPDPAARNLAGIFLLSLFSTAAWTTGGWEFLRRRSRRGWLHILAATVAAILSVGMIARI